MLRTYIRILNALFFKEAALRARAPLDTIVALLEPALLIGLLIFVFTVSGRRITSPIGGPVELFYATGFFPLYLFLHLSRRLRAPRAGKHLPAEQRLDFIIVHVVLRVVDFTVLGFLIFSVLYIVSTDRAIPINIPAILGACIAIVALGFGWLTLNLTIGTLFRQGSRLWPIVFGTVSRSLIIFSGIFYVADFLAPDARYFVSFNPLLHAVQLFRMGFYPQHPTLIFDGAYLALWSLNSVALGLVLERATIRLQERSR
jgi:capsular polysaccharide transport system permease protein